jgi:pimeloyl-ACP methyl ester carboxylesterase
MNNATTDLPPEGRMASVNGIDMYYETYGQGPPLILLHGFLHTSSMWKPYIAALAEYYRVIAVDLRGHGRSSNPANQFTHRLAALDVYALMEHLGIDRFKAIGFSSGGMTLLHMATQQPERVEAMVLIDATHYTPEQCRAILRTVAVDAPPPWGGDWQYLVQREGKERAHALITQWANGKDSYDDMNFTPPYLSTITARTLIVHGDRDQFFPVSIPVEMYRAIPHAYLWVVPNGTHKDHRLFADPYPYAGVFTQTALEFLNGDWETVKE